MKSNVLSSLVALGLVLAACGDDTTGGGGSGGSPAGGNGGNGTGGDPSTGGTPIVTGGSGGGGGMVGDGNDTIATADPLEENVDFPGNFGIQGDLDPAETDVDFFSFTGVAGPVQITSDAKPDTDPFADFYPDLVVTLFDANGNQLAQNDDPFPRTTQDAEFFTILPAAGTYYVKVEEFCEFAPSGTCDPDYFTSLESTAYAVNVLLVDPALNSVIDEAPEPNSVLASASVMEYELNPNATNPGTYYLGIGYGDFSNTTDPTDGVVFNIPDDVFFDPASQPSATITFPPPGTDGNGSSVNQGVLEVVDDLGTVVSRFDMSAEGTDPNRSELTFPVALGSQYLLRINDGPPSDGSAPFYFFLHSVGGGNPLETDEAGNNSIINAEALTESANQPGFYFVEGALGTGDVDHFSVNVADETFTVVCSSGRSGSGVQGFHATVLKASDGAGVPGGTATENLAAGDTSGLLIQDLVPPAGETDLVVKLEKTGQDATNTGTFYRCGLLFQPAAP